ncbi:MAG TPA: hypothetical protein DCX14_01200 [Flavobacteriales bacterium]|jgi:4-amino-4-deoxy-L-arabinose transferase-like glycosyltransferase|nr:hypothetical protein [Flavobacteriales bacterium]
MAYINIIKSLYVPETFRAFAYGFVLGAAFMSSPALAMLLLAAAIAFLWLSRATTQSKDKT